MGVGKRGVLGKAVPVQAKETKKPVRRGGHGSAVLLQKQSLRAFRDDRLAGLTHGYPKRFTRLAVSSDLALFSDTPRSLAGSLRGIFPRQVISR